MSLVGNNVLANILIYFVAPVYNVLVSNVVIIGIDLLTNNYRLYRLTGL